MIESDEWRMKYGIGVTVSVAARALGVSAQTVVKWADQGLIKAYRSSGGWRYFEPKDVMRLAKERMGRYG